MNKRVVEYDLIRVVAAIMVVVLHVSVHKWYTTPVDSWEWHVMNFYDSLTRSAVPLFFMVSGVVFLSRDEISIERLWKHNILHLVWIYVLWSALYAVDHLGIYKLTLEGFFARTLRSADHLWFIPSLVGVYILLPMILGAIKYKDGKYEKYFIAIFILFGVMKATLNALPWTSDEVRTIIGKVNVEWTSYIGYYILGHYLAKCDTKKYKRMCLVVFTITVSVATIVGGWWAASQGEPSGILYGYTTLPVFVEAVCLFVFLKECKIRSGSVAEKVVTELASSTLMIYLFHVFVYKHLDIWFGIHPMSFNTWLSIPVISFVSVAVCVGVWYIVKRIPIVNKILI